MTRLSLSDAHRMVSNPLPWLLALLLARLERRRAVQIALPGVRR